MVTRSNTWQDAYSTGLATLDLGDGIKVPLPTAGLGNVNNTADADKPVSSATEAALDSKVGTDVFDLTPGVTEYTDGDVVTIGNHAYVTRSDVNMAIVQSGGENYENVIGGNLANVNTSTSNLTGAPTLTGTDGQWCFILSGYDNVANGWAIVLNGFHNKVAETANHATISGGSIHSIQAGVNYSTIGGGTGNTIATGGSGATIAGGLTHTVSGSSATVGGGNTNTASGFHATIGGGGTNIASGGNAPTVSGGDSNTASGAGSVVPGGTGNTAPGYHSTAGGRGSIATSGGMRSYGAQFTAPGDAQDSTVIMKRETTDATAGGLSCDGSSGLVIPENTTWAISGLLIARRTDADDENAAWKFECLLKRNAGNTAALVGAAVITPIGTTNTWVLAITSASAGNLNVTVTGEAAKTIRWVATLRIAHVSG